MPKAFPQSLILLCAALLAGLLTAWFHPRAPAYSPTTPGVRSPLALTVEQVTELSDPVLWVDARDASAFARRHVPGALHLNEANWESGFEPLILQWTPDQVIIVYCDASGCQASEAVVIRLRRELGAERIFYLEGGWESWLANR